ncbi:MAG: hypothetical protein M1833_005237 [Piccolia ochrophora]|nr:MAG: hypothetical protein M1833_005237 [Piccolia ochrophora]
MAILDPAALSPPMTPTKRDQDASAWGNENINPKTNGQGIAGTLATPPSDERTVVGSSRPLDNPEREVSMPADASPQLSYSTDLQPRNLQGSYIFKRTSSGRMKQYGQGAWSNVYEADYFPKEPSSNPPQATSSPRLVAVKTPDKHTLQPAAPILLHEAQILTYLHLHRPAAAEYIVPFHGVDPSNTSLVLASLPLTLAAYSASALYSLHTTTSTMRDPVVGTSTFLHLATRLISGLAFLHAHAVVHGDIKPANILLRPSLPPTPLYADFSSATITHASIPATPAPAITHAYTAPELLAAFLSSTQSPVATPASDVYALGATLLVPATGAEAYAGVDARRRLAMAMDGQVLPWAACGAQGSRVVKGTLAERVVRRAVGRDSGGRIGMREWGAVVEEEIARV